jgi:hypothetical protein
MGQIYKVIFLKKLARNVLNVFLIVCLKNLLQLKKLAALCWFSIYVASCHPAVMPQSSVKNQFNCTLNNLTLKSNCKAQRVSKNLKKL